jgi:hypothetical protein
MPDIYHAYRQRFQKTLTNHALVTAKEQQPYIWQHAQDM